ncbi:hypothetical protein Tco_0955797 [Tanacetum coccineum]|uniref:Uncharacterized protein n=1 Tax=Tanacetum coccineum TaxID=301880 RepID=A0ABQ5E903_9ASTR
MASMNTRLNIKKLDGNIVQKNGSSKQVGFKQLGHKQVGFKQLGPVTQRWLEDKQPEDKTNTDCLVKEQEKVHLGIKVGANITVTGVPGQEGAEGNVAGKKKVKESMKANLGKLLKYNAWSTRWSPIRVLASRVLINMNQDYFMELIRLPNMLSLSEDIVSARLTYYVCDGKKWISGPRFILKKICNEKGGMKVDEGLIIDARNGDDSLISHATTEEKFSKRGEFLCQTQLYYEFLLEKMDEITNKVVAEDVDEVKEVKKKGHVSKQKALTSGANTVKMSLKCMGHDRGWEEAASVISRAFIGLNTCNVALLEAVDESWEEAVIKMLTYRRVLPLVWTLSWT